MQIKQLSPTIINRIAAGEVIERPASAVKELVENAIDAGATKINITIEAGGQNLIIIEDNGCGLTPAELELAVERHTTSKLIEEDLFNINFFGFRGEALASIASVSRLTMSSRSLDCEIGHSIFVEGGVKHEVEPANVRIGTKVEVRDLFFATPARLKFLKSPRAEAQQVVNIIQRIALAHPEIAFTLTSEGKQILFTTAYDLTAKLSRISDLFGHHIADNLIPLGYDNHNIRLNGFISLPTHNYRNSDYIYCYVNNRPVKDKLIQQAIRIAYQDVMSRERFPAVFLFINLPNYEVDVNVHPAKTEVRFKEEALLKSVIIAAIRRNLSNKEYNLTSTTLTENLKNKFQNEFQSQAINQNFNFNPSSAPVIFNETKIDYLVKDPVITSTKIYSVPQFKPDQEVPQISSISLSNNIYPLGLAKCQINKTYIIAENEEGLIIVDQHAAHERIIYEQLKEMLKKEGIPKQRLLIPEIIHLNMEQYQKLHEHKVHLNNLGLEMIFHENNEIEILATPSAFGNINLEKLLMDLAADLLDYNQATIVEEIFEHIYETLACHSSIRAGRVMNNLEMNNLLRQIENTQMSAQCNHGRPTFIKLKFSDIENLFGRG